jgi:Alr-MurF fusion protein
MEKLERIISPDIGVFTNIGQAHQENFVSVQQKIKEKLSALQKLQNNNILQGSR